MHLISDPHGHIARVVVEELKASAQAIPDPTCISDPNNKILVSDPTCTSSPTAEEEPKASAQACRIRARPHDAVMGTTRGVNKTSFSRSRTVESAPDTSEDKVRYPPINSHARARPHAHAHACTVSYHNICCLYIM